MSLERRLISRYCLSYLTCLLIAWLGQRFIPPISLGISQTLHLTAALSLGWQAAWTSTSGLSRALSVLGWRPRRALRVFFLCAICVSASVTVVELTSARSTLHTLNVRVAPSEQATLCVSTLDTAQHCESLPWGGDSKLKEVSQEVSDQQRARGASKSTIPVAMSLAYPPKAHFRVDQSGFTAEYVSDVRAELITAMILRGMWLLFIIGVLSLELHPRGLFMLTAFLSVLVEHVLEHIQM